MSRFDLAIVPSWLLALLAAAALAALGLWSQSVKLTSEPLATTLPLADRQQEQKSKEPLRIKDFSGLALVRPQDEKSILDRAAEILDDEQLAMVERTLARDSGDWHLVAVERREGELVAIMFYKDEIRSITASVGDTVRDHMVRSIDQRGVTLMPSAGTQPIRLELKKEQPRT